MLLVVDENIDCVNSSDEFILVTKDNKDIILGNILERMLIVPPQQIRIPKKY